jgi:sulfate adenylyltransferase subunit 1
MLKIRFKEQNVSYIPLSALTGDNVVESLGGMVPANHSEHQELEPADVYEKGKARFPVQIIRPKQKNTTILEAMPENCMGIISKWAMR